MKYVNQSTRYLFAPVTVLILMACGKQNASPAQRMAQPTPAPTINSAQVDQSVLLGAWKSACSLSANGSSSQEVFEFASAKSFSIKQIQFSNTECSLASTQGQWRFVATYEILAAIAGAPANFRTLKSTFSGGVYYSTFLPSANTFAAEEHYSGTEYDTLLLSQTRNYQRVSFKTDGNTLSFFYSTINRADLTLTKLP